MWYGVKSARRGRIPFDGNRRRAVVSTKSHEGWQRVTKGGFLDLLSCMRSNFRRKDESQSTVQWDRAILHVLGHLEEAGLCESCCEETLSVASLRSTCRHPSPLGCRKPWAIDIIH